MGTGTRCGKESCSSRMTFLRPAKVFHHFCSRGVRQLFPGLFLAILDCYFNVQNALAQLQSYPQAR
jgi:hypothetical protein